MAWQLLNANILPAFDNGTFEDVKANWGAYTEYVNQIIRSSDHAVQGTFSARIEGQGFATSVPSYFQNDFDSAQLFLHTAIPNVVAGRRYKVTLQVGFVDWPNDNNDSVLAVNVSVPNNEVLNAVTRPPIILGTTFGPITFDFVPTVSASSKSVFLYCLFNDNSGSDLPSLSSATYLDQFEVEEYIEGMEVVISKQNCSQYQADDGSIFVNVFKGSGNYSFAWDDGPTTQSRTNLAPGLYTVTVTDDDTGEVQVFEDIEITEPQPTEIFADFDITDAVCNGGSTGAIDITSISGGDGGPYTFDWDDGPTSQNRSMIPAGTYAVTIEDGSSNTEYFDNLVVGEPTAIAINATISGQNINVDVSGGTPPYTYAWDDDPGVTSKDRTNLDPGDYTITVTDANGCTNQAVITVAQFRFFFTRNPMILELSAVDPGTKPNLSFLCEVHIERNYLSGTFEKVATQEQPADVNGETTFDNQGILDGFDGLKRFLPDFNDNTMKQASSIFKRFFLKYTEKYGDPPAEDPFTEGVINYMVLGGLSYEEYASDYFFTDYLDAQKPFFTWHPNDKDVFEDQQEYLFFMVPQFTVTELHVKCDIHLIDSTVINVDLYSITSNVNRYEIYCIPAGFLQNALDNQASADQVDRWNIFVQDQNENIISEVRTFYMIHDYFPFIRYFLFRNSLGGMDTFAATGRGNLKARPKSEEIEKLLPHNYSISDAPIEVTSKLAEMEEEVNSGYIRRRAELQWLNDFLISEDVFILENGRFIPIQVDGSGVIRDDDSKPVSIKFDAIRPKVDNYTPFLGNNAIGGGETIDPEEYLLVNSTFLRVNRG